MCSIGVEHVFAPEFVPVFSGSFSASVPGGSFLVPLPLDGGVDGPDEEEEGDEGPPVLVVVTQVQQRTSLLRAGKTSTSQSN